MTISDGTSKRLIYTAAYIAKSMKTLHLFENGSPRVMQEFMLYQ